MSFIYLDTEYVNPQEPSLDPICCALSQDGKPTETFWLQDGSDTDKLKNRLADFSGYLVAYNVAAEARVLMALGMDPFQFKWVDLMVEWKALQNCNDSFKFGHYFDKHGNLKKSDPGVWNPHSKERVGQRDPYMIGTGLADAAAHLLQVNLDKTYKSASIDLILTRGRDGSHPGMPFSDSERQDILEYCASDIKYLREMLSKILAHETRLWGLDLDTLLMPAIVERARFNVCMAVLESRGFPMDTQILNNLTTNYAKIAEACYEDMNSVFPVFEQSVKCGFKPEHKEEALNHISTNIPDWPRTASGKLEMKSATIAKYRDKFPRQWLTPLFKGKWVKKAANIAALIEQQNLPQPWPRTEKGAYKTDEATLKEFSFIPAIESLRKNSKTLTQINWFRPAAAPELHAKIGQDGRLRPYFNPYGAQSGRSQPPAKSYPFLWSSWLRCAVRPQPGTVMISADYGSQEFVVAAALSKDENMLAAYDSGDPYLYFAKLAGAVPWDGTKKEYADERDMFKEVVLGLQFGLGVEKLSIALTHKLGRTVSKAETASLVNKHKKAFHVFWAWTDDILHHYFQAKKPLILGYNMSDLYSDESKGDLWPVNLDNPNPLSIKNVPVQGVSATIMRRAVNDFIDQDIPIFATLHDGFYFQCTESQKEEYTDKIVKIMNDSCIELIGRDIRIDIDVYGHDQLYVPPKGKAEFERFKHYILSMDNQ